MKTIVVSLLASLLLLFRLNGQSLLNGSFESNGGSCMYNIANATFNSNMANTVGFGIASQLDIIATSCGFGAAQSGSWFVAMAVDITNTQNDAFSMRLSAPLVSGTSYTLSWYDRGWSPYSTNVLRVGLSATNNAFGSLLYTAPLPTIGTWVSRSVTFNAPLAGQFVTAQVIVGAYGWTHVDNFALGVVLPVRELSFYGTPGADGVDSLFWEAKEEQAVASYQVEYLSGQGAHPPVSDWIPVNGDVAAYRFASWFANDDPYPHQYRLRIKDMNGEETLSNVITVDQAEHGELAGLEVFPNPNQGAFTVRFFDPTIRVEEGTIRIYDLRGGLVKEMGAANEVEVSLEDQAAGLYVVQLVLPNGVWNRKVLVE